MKITYSMLRDFVETKLDAEAIGELLTMAGFELEGIEQLGGEDVLDIKVVSNRGDGLSVFGLAREVLAKDQNAVPTELYQRAAKRFVDVSIKGVTQIPATTAGIASKGCRRFAVRAFDEVDAKGSAPDWMKARLTACGMRPISILVDLTNYVMLELGQPLHAFDREKLSGDRLEVRHAESGEKLTTLNGDEHELDGQMMICDAQKPVGVPGVMGGLDTEVTDSTTRILLESANFVNRVVRKTRKQLGLNTEASYRFERSVDPEGVVAATLRFSELLSQSQPEVRASNVVDLYLGKADFKPVTLRVERASMLLGMEIAATQAQNYLSRLGMDVSRLGEVLTVQPPSWRPDITREEDLVEELGRVHGYELIPESLPFGHTPLGGSQGKELFKDKLREAVLRGGFTQIISHSLRSEHILDEPCERVGPRNPSSPEHNLLRSSLLPSLADAFNRNGNRDLHLFEMGKVFYQFEGVYCETLYLGLMSHGALAPTARQVEKPTQADFFSMKSAVLDALAAMGIDSQVNFVVVDDEPDSRFHPTRTAYLKINGKTIGTLGQIHPLVAEQCSLDKMTMIAEIAVEMMMEAVRPELSVKSISRSPAIRRDIAILVPKSIPFSTIEAAILSALGDLLEKQWLFDVFEGTGIPEGSHSLGIGLQFRKFGENFTDEEANQVRDEIVAELAKLGATLR
jgi:phenylalanyl-tRNA synthetase beta chain